MAQHHACMTATYEHPQAISIIPFSVSNNGSLTVLGQQRVHRPIRLLIQPSRLLVLVLPTSPQIFQAAHSLRQVKESVSKAI